MNAQKKFAHVGHIIIYFSSNLTLVEKNIN